MEDTSELMEFKDFPKDKRGFLLPGPIVRHYRLAMTYVDNEGRKRRWTQQDLGKLLNLSEVSIRAMEKQSKFLDSIERRRFLSEMLQIPPILLGLGSLAELEQVLQGKPRMASVPRKASVSSETANLYREAYLVYSTSHSNGNISENAKDIEAWIRRIEGDLESAGKLRSELNLTLWKFHYLLSKVYGNDLGLYKPSFSHLNHAMAIATTLNDPNLKASTMYLSAEVHFAQQALALARSDMIAAVDFAKSANAGVKAGVYTYAALAYALTKQDLSDGIYIERLLGWAENCADRKMDVPFLRMDYGKFLLDSGDVLVTLGKYGKAIELLDASEEYIDLSRPRKYAQIQLLQAMAAMNSKQHDYEYATSLLMEATKIGKSVDSSYTLGFARRLHGQLAKTSFTSHPQFAELTIALK